MLLSARSLSSVLAALALAGACTKPEAAPDALPPAGLAGGGAAPGADPTALPGAGFGGVVASTGGGSLGGGDTGALPSGHPPVGGAQTAPPPAKVDPSSPALNLPPKGIEPTVILTGTVQETMDVPDYTYMRIKMTSGETWVAIPRTRIQVGDVVTVNQSLAMDGFHSKVLNKSFDRLVMGMLVGAPKRP
jgi:hypothetical protein